MAKYFEVQDQTWKEISLITGIGIFGGRTLSAEDAFEVDYGEFHDIQAVTELVFFATSLPRSSFI